LSALTSGDVCLIADRADEILATTQSHTRVRRCASPAAGREIRWQ
jgi:hypothetical protein